MRVHAQKKSGLVGRISLCLPLRLRRYAVDVAREHRAFLDIGDA